MSRKKNNLLIEIKELLANSLEGKRMEILFHPDNSIMAFGEVEIVDETRGTLIVKCKDGEYRLIPKAPNAKFRFTLEHGTVTLPGTRLMGTLRQRRKQKISKW